MPISDLWEKLNKILLIPVVIALIGLGGFSFNQYKDYQRIRNERIAKQLSDFYVPLNTIFRASGNEWREFRKRYASNRKAYFDGVIGIRNSDGSISYTRDCNTRQPEQALAANSNASSFVIKRCPVSTEELRIWTLQMKGTFKPHHEQLEALILKNRHLVGQDVEMNRALDELLLHISGYKLAFSKWEIGDYSQMTSHNNFPSYIDALVEKRLSKLSLELDPIYANTPLQRDASQAPRP